MASAQWPDYGRFLVSRRRERPRPRAERTEMESGPPKQARSPSRVRWTIETRVQFTASEYSSFKSWWREALGNGMDWFDMIDDEGNTREFRIVRGEFETTLQPTISGASPDRIVEMTLECWS